MRSLTACRREALRLLSPTLPVVLTLYGVTAVPTSKMFVPASEMFIETLELLLA
jgi:hypothetical protein